MKRTLCLLLILLIAAACCSCSGAGPSEKEEKLTYYFTTEHPDDMVDTIQRYNRWCSSHSSEEMKIELIEFDNFKTMSERLNIEVMSGGGPDLFSNYMDLPFEKMLQSGAFLDLNELIENDTAQDKIDLSHYNKTIMDAGVYDGKRYFIPAFYRVHTLIGEKEVLEKFGMPTQQGYHLTFDNMDSVFSAYLENPDDYYYMISDTQEAEVNADTVILQLINSQVDFKSQTSVFDAGFMDKLELMTKLREHIPDMSDESAEAAENDLHKVLFSPVFTYSNPIYMERMLGITEMDFGGMDVPQDALSAFEISDPVLYSCFEKDESTYSAGVADAIFVNAKTKKDDKVLAFLKYLLGDHIQNLYSGTDEEYWFGGGSDCIPVLNSAYENCVRDAHKVTDVYGGSVEVKEELSPVTQALIDHIGKINHVYLYLNLNDSNYDRNVAVPILTDYWDGKIDSKKCADYLSSATKIYNLE